MFRKLTLSQHRKSERSICILSLVYTAVGPGQTGLVCLSLHPTCHSASLSMGPRVPHNALDTIYGPPHTAGEWWPRPHHDIYYVCLTNSWQGFLGGLSGKESAGHCRTKRWGSSLGWEDPLKQEIASIFCLGDSMDQRIWRATVQGDRKQSEVTEHARTIHNSFLPLVRPCCEGWHL